MSDTGTGPVPAPESTHTPGPVFRDRGVIIHTLITEIERLKTELDQAKGEVQRVRALADAFADDGLARYGGNIAWHIEDAIANEKGDFPDAADRHIASQRERAEAAEAETAALRARIDALIQHRGHANQRKAVNSESNSDVRADVCADLIRRINAAASTPTETQAEGGCECGGPATVYGSDGRGVPAPVAGVADPTTGETR